MNFKKTACFLSVATLAPSYLSGADKSKEHYNVLFIMADDMRPEMGCYGIDNIQTPNLDKLAATGNQFMNAYCNVPVSGASRASLLTGVYPKFPQRFTSYNSSASIDAPFAVPISEWFTENGYYTVSNGKVFHNIQDHASTWSEYPWRVHREGYGADWAEYNKWELWMSDVSGRTINPKTMRGPFFEAADVADDAYADGKLALRTIADLERLGQRDEPFFLACGFWRPHLPFNAPKKYWDLYERAEIALAGNQKRPPSLPKEVTGSQEIFSYAGVKSTADEDFQRLAKHGYYACISYIDAQVGLLLDALDELGLADNTIVVFLGDHGWHLGENSFWGKHNLLKRSTHVPLLIRVPGSEPRRVKDVVEFVDLYPTLCEICGIKTPPKQLDGKVMNAFIESKSKVDVRNKAYIQWQGGTNVVDKQFSYSEWSKPNGTTSSMLFDHAIDEEETINRTDDKTYTKIKNRLSYKLSEFIKLINR